MTADIKTAERIANEIRINVIKQVYYAKSGHPGGSLSAADILTAIYFMEMNTDPANPTAPGRDKFVLSKGHAAPLLYAALAEKGFFPKEELWKLRKTDAMLQGHPSRKSTPGVEISTGSLGQGFSAAVGMALAARLDRAGRVYVLLGDGELQEGLVWEAAMSAAHYKLDNLCAVLDLNGLQIDGKTEAVMNVEPAAEKFTSFGFHVIRVNGHDLSEIANALAAARNTKGRPTILIADTIKGKGVSFMENEAGWHGKAPTEEETIKALAELGGRL